jgi:hypothetical protein
MRRNLKVTTTEECKNLVASKASYDQREVHVEADDRVQCKFENYWVV